MRSEARASERGALAPRTHLVRQHRLVQSRSLEHEQRGLTPRAARRTARRAVDRVPDPIGHAAGRRRSRGPVGRDERSADARSRRHTSRVRGQRRRPSRTSAWSRRLGDDRHVHLRIRLRARNGQSETYGRVHRPGAGRFSSSARMRWCSASWTSACICRNDRQLAGEVLRAVATERPVVDLNVGHRLPPFQRCVAQQQPIQARDGERSCGEGLQLPRQVTRLSATGRGLVHSASSSPSPEESRNGTSVRSTTISQRAPDRSPRRQRVAQRLGVRQVDVAAELDQHRRSAKSEPSRPSRLSLPQASGASRERRWRRRGLPGETRTRRRSRNRQRP